MVEVKKDLSSRFQQITIKKISDMLLAQNLARNIAENIGFNKNISEDIALVAKELATNLIKHAKCGTMILKLLSKDGKIGIEIDSIDTGPGIIDVNVAIRDGYSTVNSLGYGLGIINRIMDEFNVESSHQGTRIITKRWIKNYNNNKNCPLKVGIASRAHPKMRLNGDTFIKKKWNHSLLVGIIDGLGHGQNAYYAAQTARKYILDHFDQPFENILKGVDRACRATRGVVMALARFDWDINEITFVSIGDVSVRVINSPQKINFLIKRGIIGVSYIKPIINRKKWDNSYVLILYSDGISSKWRWEDFSYLFEKSPEIIAKEMLIKLGKENDDATVLIVRER